MDGEAAGGRAFIFAETPPIASIAKVYSSDVRYSSPKVHASASLSMRLCISVLCAFCFKWESRRLCGVRSPLCLVHWLNTLKFVERRGAPPQNHELGSNQACSPLCAVHLLNTLTFVERRGSSPQNHELGSNQVRAQCFSHSSIVSHHSSANVSLDFSSDQKIFTRALLQLGSWMKLQRLEWWAVEAGVS